MKSILEKRGAVTFPAFLGERVYMREFRKKDGLPADLARWQSTVDAMLSGVDVAGPVYLMVDQGLVKAGSTQRRGGLHIDGYWIAESQCHGSHSGRRVGWDTGPKWKHCDFSEPEAVILAGSVCASRALVGTYDGKIGDGGDCRHIDTEGLREVVLREGVAYAGNVSMLHESTPVVEDCYRTLVRLNVPGWSPTVLNC